MKAVVCCLDLEGVLVPEIWIQVSKKTRIPALRLTTRDVPDYDLLMRRRLSILKKHGIKLKHIQKIIASISPLGGARRFLDRLRSKHPVVILSDTYYEFAMPLMKKLGYPALFCNRLSTDRRGFIAGYHLRERDGKAKAVSALRRIGFKVSAAGDSYNDITMLKAADKGILFNPPPRIARKFPCFKIARTYPELLRAFDA